MRTDELRAALRELADEEQPAPADLVAVHRRDRRRKTAIRASAALVVVVVTAGVFALARSSSTRRVEVSNSPKELDHGELDHVDFVVVPADAKTRDALDHTPLVRRFAPIPKRSSASRNLFFQGVGTRKALCALERSDGFAVETNDAAGDRLATLTAAMPSGTQVVDLTNGADVEVFMTTKATPAQIAAVRGALAHFPGVSNVTYFDHNRAYEEFKRIFADQQDLVASTTPDVLPESFRMNTAGAAATKAVETAFQGRPGVDTVVGSERQKPAFFGPEADAGPSTTLNGQPAPVDTACVTP